MSLEDSAGRRSGNVDFGGVRLRELAAGVGRADNKLAVNPAPEWVAFARSKRENSRKRKGVILA